MKTAHKVCAWLLVALGAVHTAVTPLVVERFSARAVWFAGAGLAMIFGGFLNVVLNGSRAALSRAGRALCHAANLLMLVFGALAVTVVPEPQAYFALLLIVVVTFTAYTLS